MAVQESSYEKLVELFLSGSDLSFEEFLQEHEAKLFHLALHIVGNFADAEDVLLEVFLRAREKLGRDINREQAKTWLYRVTVSAALRTKGDQAILQKILVGRVFPEPLSARGEEETDEDISEERQKKVMQYAISRLPEAYKTVFLLRDVSAFTVSGIAEILTLDEWEVRARLHRARLMILRCMRRYNSLQSVETGKKVFASTERKTASVPVSVK